MKKCKSTIVFGDDEGDNETTFHCQLELGHCEPCQEKGVMYGQFYLLVWSKDMQKAEKP